MKGNHLPPKSCRVVSPGSLQLGRWFVVLFMGCRASGLCENSKLARSCSARLQEGIVVSKTHARPPRVTSVAGSCAGISHELRIRTHKNLFAGQPSSKLTGPAQHGATPVHELTRRYSRTRIAPRVVCCANPILRGRRPAAVRIAIQRGIPKLEDLVQLPSDCGVHSSLVVYCTLFTELCWKFAWLNKLNASARNFSRAARSALKPRATLKSTSRTPGPRND